MKRYTPHIIACATLLLVAIAVRALLYWPAFVEYFPYFMWVHVAIIAFAFYGIWVLRGSQQQPAMAGVVLFFRGFPLWLAALAVPAVFAVAQLIPSATSSLGTTPDGKPIHSKSWVTENGRHYVVLNRTTKVQISPAEHLEADREGSAVFAHAWIFFSYTILVLWHYIRRRESTLSAG